jgi:lipopolysaccharide/colanic/teichoic acid biosynthesis glycosyltransferase
MRLSRSNPQTPPRYRRRSILFALSLLFYLLTTVALFDVVWYYMPHIADRVGHIEYGWLRFSIYLAVYACFTLGGSVVLPRLLPRTFSREGVLRTSFVAGITLSFAVAAYQNRFGTGMSATYFVVGTLGAFVGVLAATQRHYGLIEVNDPPPPDIVAEVLRGHADVVIANDVWDHVKRGIEIVLSVALIILSLPISLLLAMVIWVQDPGPLLFAKIVVTRGGRTFRQLKLRSMIKDAEQATGAIPAALVDARITPLGQALRRTHIDELPQMINIAWGDMSLVGPRPERVRFVRQHLKKWPNYRCRHAVRPGLAGMAQVYGDYYSTPREKLRYDLLYIRRRSFGLDLKLFASATLLGLIGLWPGMHRGRRAFTARRQEERWRRAYEALHGGEPDAGPIQSARTATERSSVTIDHRAPEPDLRGRPAP